VRTKKAIKTSLDSRRGKLPKLKRGPKDGGSTGKKNFERTSQGKNRKTKGVHSERSDLTGQCGKEIYISVEKKTWAKKRKNFKEGERIKSKAKGKYSLAYNRMEREAEKKKGKPIE